MLLFLFEIVRILPEVEAKLSIFETMAKLDFHPASKADWLKMIDPTLLEKFEGESLPILPVYTPEDTENSISLRFHSLVPEGPWIKGVHIGSSQKRPQKKGVF